MIERMLISIFSPTKNRATSFMPQLLASIIAQKIPSDWSLEWVVCDDGSTEHELQALKSLLSSALFETQLIERPVSLGVSEGRNDAYRACRGEFILDVDDDDLLTDDAVALRVSHLIETGAAWSFTNAYQVSEDLVMQEGRHFIENWNHNSLSQAEVLRLLLNHKAFFWASTRTYRAGALGSDADFIAWKPKYVVAQDLEHWINLTVHIGPPVHLNAFTVLWREKEHSHGINGKRSGLQAELIADIQREWAAYA
jgi:glycosyltransferase involved in cell wall biosynthesis